MGRGERVDYFPVLNEEIELKFEETDDLMPAWITAYLPIEACEAGLLEPEVTFLWSNVGTTDSHFRSSNNHSVVFRIDFGNVSSLFTGDLEHHGIHELAKKYANSTDLLDVDVFQVGHHGSHNATSEHLIELVSPKLAIFSAGDPLRQEGTFNAYRFAHPNHKAVRTLDDPWRGVFCNREPEDVPVGIKGAWRDRDPVWELWTLKSTLFSTGWDGSIVLDAMSEGDLSITTENQGDDTGFVCP